MGKWEMVRLGDVCEGKSSNIAQKDLEQNEGDYPIFGASGLIKHVDFYRHDFEYIAVVKDGAGVGRTTLCPPKSSVIGTMQAILPKPSINSRYLYYAISGMNLASYYTGATIPHIYFKDYSKEMLALPPLPVQQQIAEVLDRASALIEKRKAQIEKLDLLVKSQFTQMFGDPVTNPKGWEYTTLGSIVEISSSKRIFESEYVSSGIPFYRTKEIVELSKGRTISTELYISQERYEEIRRKHNVPAVGDMLVSAVGTIGVIWVVNTKEPFYFKDGNLLWLRCGKECSSVFMKYLLSALIDYYKKDLTAGSAYNALTIVKLKQMKTHNPPLSLQREFASFVGQVETQKTLLQQSLAKLEQNYKSLLQKCFRGEIF
ncbi:restriction endonuclease subunit S [Ruminococcaceae bacterium OttesenSCG-928-A16]|nr:restriction endonuclease subunit S [Ruminococcaceae bacterium OttesenSCG-928-A16]